MLAGKTTMAIRGADGAWEIFAFASALLIGERTYRLSRLLRGLGGEEALAGRVVPAGAPVVLLDDALLPLSSGLSGLGLTNVYRIGPAALDIADPAYVETTATAAAKAFQPYAPVGPKAVRAPAGITISFVRRGRREANAWEVIEIPLAEDSEAYAVEIRQGGALKRLLSCNLPQVLYAAADELADFGSAQTSLDLAVYQVSTAVGRGFALRANVPVR